MKLMKLTLSNFKGVRHLAFEPNGKNASVYGTNASGKTTLFDALTWLLFDKASTGEPGFSPKTLGADGQEIHNLNNRVDGIFMLDNGQLITFTKDQSENWVKKRGSASEDFAGNKTEYYIDGVPVKKAEYEARIATICPSDKVQIFTQPLYFPRMLDWKTRRKILLEVCGDITDYDVINSSAEMREITRFLLKPGTQGQFYTVEECSKIAGARYKDIRRRLDEIPARIDEATMALIDDGGIDCEAVKACIATLQKELDAAIAEKANASESAAVAAMRQQLAELRANMAEARTAYQQSKNARLCADRDRLAQLNAEHRDLLYRVSGLKSTMEQYTADRGAMETKRQAMVADYKVCEAREWEGDTVCPVCNQAFPQDKIDAARAEFNTLRSTELERIRRRLETECSKAMIAALSDKIQSTNAQIATLEHQAGVLKGEIDDVIAAISPIEQEMFDSTPEYAALCSEIAQIEAKLAVGDDSADEIKNAAQAKIDRIRDDVSSERKKLLVLQTNEQQRGRIAALEAEEKKLQTEAEEAEYCLHLCEEFVKTKVAMLDEKINARFENVRFRLFETQINGGIKEGCDVMIPSPRGLIPFASANNAAKLNAGLEIIDTLARFYGVAMPVFVDNAESVVTLNPIMPQVIRLVVSSSDETLRMEVAE